MSLNYAGSRTLPLLVAINGLLVVSLGAFGAHGLKAMVSVDALHFWQTGVRYHMFHVVALLACAFLASTCEAKPRAARWAILAAGLFVLGIIFFSGSLYLLVLIQKSWLALTAATGGVFFLLGWASLIICIFRR